MKNTIIETINGLLLAKSARENKLADIKGKDNTEMVVEFKNKLEEELKAKVEQFIAGIEGEREAQINKTSGDIATINELLDEFETQLADIEATEAELPTEAVEDENDINETETDCEEETETPTIVTMPTINTPID